MEHFVNPYTFVPFSPHPPVRENRRGHDGRGSSGLLSGRLRIRITTRTPLLVRGFGAVAGSDDVEAVPSRPDGAGGRELIVPGSAVQGAVRSLHEALSNSCLRVFDADLVPQYRQLPDPHRIGQLRLAVVDIAGQMDGKRQGPPTLRLCEPADDPVRHRIAQSQLEGIHREHRLRSGDRLAITCDAKGRPVTAVPDPDGDWVVVISDANARRNDVPYHAHVRRLTERRVLVDETAWRQFLDLAEGSDDLRTARLRKVPETERFLEVDYQYAPAGGPRRRFTVGERHLVRRTVIAGQPLWVRLSADGTVVDVVQPALIWREFGAGAAGERIAPGFEPCTDSASLCPSCRLFGSADVGGRADGDRAAQRSYRGHVRFGDVVAQAAPRPLQVTLPPLGAPRPGSGQHYLKTEDWAGDGSIQPLREWGSAADRRGELRRLRGRKFYWHTTVPNGRLPRRGQARGQDADNEMVTRAQVFMIGTQFTGTIAFTDLDEVALGSLIAALQPHRVLGEQALLHIGGGKPIGYGSCRIDINTDASWISTARDRYLGVAPSALDEERAAALTEKFALADSTTAARESIWPSLAKAVELDHVPGAQVWYPPGATDLADENFDRGFPYWKQTSGWKSDRRDGPPRGYPLQPLPDIEQQSQEIEIVTRNEQKRLSRNRRR